MSYTERTPKEIAAMIVKVFAVVTATLITVVIYAAINMGAIVSATHYAKGF